MQIDRHQALTITWLTSMWGRVIQRELKDGAEIYQVGRADLGSENSKMINHQNALYPSYADAIRKSRANAADNESAS